MSLRPTAGRHWMAWHMYVKSAASTFGSASQYSHGQYTACRRAFSTTRLITAGLAVAHGLDARSDAPFAGGLPSQQSNAVGIMASMALLALLADFSRSGPDETIPSCLDLHTRRA